MYRSILLLVSMAGIAAGASVNNFTNVGLGTDSGLLTAWNFENGAVGSGPAKSEGTMGGWKNTPKTQFSETGSDGKFGSINSTDGYYTYQTDLTSTTKDNFSSASFTVSLDVKDLNANAGCSIFNISRYNSASVNGQQPIILTLNSAGYIAVTLAGTEVITSQTTAADLNWTTLTLTSGLATADAEYQTLTLYVNGEAVGSAQGWAKGEKATALQFGAKLGVEDGKVESMKVDNIAVWNAALTGTQVASMTVPEPATATLSLLALAGLCVRRRRR